MIAPLKSIEEGSRRTHPRLIVVVWWSSVLVHVFHVLVMFSRFPHIGYPQCYLFFVVLHIVVLLLMYANVVKVIAGFSNCIGCRF